jgi:DNA-directed RNA polymerase subunit RPC12/RpoP
LRGLGGLVPGKVASIMDNIKKIPYKTIYKCRECAATSYQPVIDRVESGRLLPTGQYKCTGCRNIFASVRAWWTPRVATDFQASRSYS